MHLDFSRKPRFASVQLARFSERMAALLQAALPLTDCLRIALPCLGRHSFRHTRFLIPALGEGSRLSIALEECGFPRSVTSLVRSGEEHGDLRLSFEKLAVYYTRQADVLQKWRKALSYPLLLCLVTCVASAYLLWIVLPQFALLYSGMRMALPAPTAHLFLFAKLMQRWLPIIVILGLFTVLILLLSRRLRSWMGQRLYRCTHWSRFFRVIVEVELAETLATFLDAGIPLIQALDLLRVTLRRSGSLSFAKHIRDDILDGCTLSESVQSWGASALFVGSIQVGERTGDLAEACRQAGLMIGRDLRDRVDTLIRWVEPMLVSVFAIWIGFLAYAMLLPSLDMVQGW